MRPLLVIRGLVGLLYAIYLATAFARGWEAYFSIFADYLIVDGVAGLAVALAMVRDSSGERRFREMVLGVVFIGDAMGRVLSGAAIHIWPGIPGFPVTAVLFLAIMAAGTLATGLAEGGLAAREEVAQHGRRHERAQLMAGPVAIASMASAAFATAAFVYIDDPDRMRRILSGYAGVAAIVMLTMAWTRRPARAS